MDDKKDHLARITISLSEGICRLVDEERSKVRLLRSQWIREAILEKLGRVEKENLKLIEMEREIERLKDSLNKPK